MMQTPAILPSVPGLGRLFTRARAQLDAPLAPPITDEQLAAIRERNEQKRLASIERLGVRYVFSRGRLAR